MPQPPQNSPPSGSAAPQLVQKAFRDAVVPRGATMELDLLAPNLRNVLRIRMAAIARRISPRKLNPGISNYSCEVPASVPSAQSAESNRKSKTHRQIFAP